MMALLFCLLASSVPARAQTAPVSGFVVNPASRELSRQFYLQVYLGAQNVPMEWTGNFATGNPGTTSASFKAGNLTQINYFRAMAGVPATIHFDDELSRKCQQSALMMSANASLSHSPPVTWIFYTADAADAAAHGNLALGSTGTEAITGLMRDNGQGNEVLGHRRWMLYPQTQTMGTGDVPKTGEFNAAHVSWVFDDNFGKTRPPTRDDFVAWPPPGYVPWQLAYPRWSFAYPAADFAGATVTMQRDGVAVAVRLEAPMSGFGENTLAWVPDNLDPDDPDASFGQRPTKDTVYTISVRNVRVKGQARDFSYQVTLFDPDMPGPDTVQPEVLNQGTLRVGTANPINIRRMPLAEGYQWSASRLAPWTSVEGGENGVSRFVIDTTPGYLPVTTEMADRGSASFHLAHPDFVTQSIQFTNRFVFQPTSKLSFSSRLGFASVSQIARAQVSLNGGLSWQDAFVQPGSNGRGETDFRQVSVSLGAFTNGMALIRFAYTLTPAGAGFPQTALGVGWYFDNISLSDTTEVLDTRVNTIDPQATPTFTPAAPGDYLLEFRPTVFGRNSVAGPLRLLTAVNGPIEVQAARLGELQLAAAGGWQFKVTGSAANTYTVESSANLKDWTAVTNLTGGTGSWTVLDAGAQGQPRRFYRVSGR